MRRQSAQLGEIIRRQRELNRLSLRQFAAMAGISNPYLSQIERGLRAPSHDVVDAIARSLRTSRDALYEQAGLVDDNGPAGARRRLVDTLEEDDGISPRERRIIMEIYDAFVAARRRPPARRRARRPSESAT